MWELLPGTCGPSRQVVSHGNGLSRQVSPYIPVHDIHVLHLLSFINGLEPHELSINNSSN